MNSSAANSSNSVASSTASSTTTATAVTKLAPPPRPRCAANSAANSQLGCFAVVAAHLIDVADTSGVGNDMPNNCSVSQQQQQQQLAASSSLASSSAAQCNSSSLSSLDDPYQQCASSTAIANKLQEDQMLLCGGVHQVHRNQATAIVLLGAMGAEFPSGLQRNTDIVPCHGTVLARAVAGARIAAASRQFAAAPGGHRFVGPRLCALAAPFGPVQNHFGPSQFGFRSRCDFCLASPQKPDACKNSKACAVTRSLCRGYPLPMRLASTSDHPTARIQSPLIRATARSRRSDSSIASDLSLLKQRLTVRSCSLAIAKFGYTHQIPYRHNFSFFQIFNGRPLLHPQHAQSWSYLVAKMGAIIVARNCDASIGTTPPIVRQCSAPPCAEFTALFIFIGHGKIFGRLRQRQDAKKSVFGNTQQTLSGDFPVIRPGGRFTSRSVPDWWWINSKSLTMIAAPNGKENQALTI
ncbi:hypothetical protein niasHT_013672 [Heterodera trifolii]|uniref:Uncharacterized protein n=1 Tax=Heterodera trifolii TaxID=157864 RepID=A0ABD2L0H3_9BILA